MIKKQKKKISKNKKKFNNNNLLNFRNKKIFKLEKSRKSFPFRNNSFICFKKKFICQKLFYQKRRGNLISNKKKMNKTKSRILKIKKFCFFLSRNEKISSSKNLSRFRNKIGYFNIIHSKESCFFLENKGIFHLANSYLKGKLLPRSFHEALVCLSNASKLGNSEALFQLGNIFFEGKGVGRNKKYSVSFFRSSGKRENKKGLYNSAFMEKRGIGFNSDSLKALHSIGKLETLGRKKKKKTKSSKKSKFSKNFYRFLQKPDETGLLRCYLNSLISFRYFSFPAVILKKAGYIGYLTNLLNRSSTVSSYESAWNLSELFLENRQPFLASKKIEEISNFYPNQKAVSFFGFGQKKNQMTIKLLLLGDSILNNNKKLHFYFLKLYDFFSRYVSAIFSFFYCFSLSSNFDSIFFLSFFMKILVLPFFE
mmetsp:Transcript_31017/g.72263  ORF Transcript_31017/g.72263 Transcript_31017/m.72263 type:complete len:424 (-) Transcript_31017:727-1998(-)